MEASDSIRESMASQPHPKRFGQGTAYLRLKPHGHTWITDSRNGSMYAEYQDEKGNWYTIEIGRGKKSDERK